MKKTIKLILLLSFLTLASCVTSCSNKSDGFFTYSSNQYTETRNEANVNNEVYDYDSIKIHEIQGTLRDDFAYGVDGSMILEIEEHGGKYYAKDGVEQDVFEIMADAGVNFLRVRNWNDPYSTDGHPFGGGTNDLENNIALAKRAKRVNMNFMLDFHYSDFWADPSHQTMPRSWKDYGVNDLLQAVYDYTYESLNAFKEEGITVDAVQIGNEINTGLVYPYGKINFSNFSGSMVNVSNLLKQGIEAAKDVFPDIKTVVHLAEGGDTAYFDQYFSALEENGVEYDIIGASYYPYWHGEMEHVKKNFENLIAKFNKPVMIVETSYGFTVEEHEYAGNIYNTTFEDPGKYKTSIQAQATLLNDLLDLMSSLSNSMGLGIFYWEPCFIPVEGAGWATSYGQSFNDYGNDLSASRYTDGLASWSNQSLFSYTGKALPSLYTYKMVKEGLNICEEEVVGLDYTSINVTLNLANNETLQDSFPVLTNFDAFRDHEVIWNEEDLAQLSRAGEYVVHGKVGSFDVTAYVTCEMNYVKDYSFEEGSGSNFSDAWVKEETQENAVKINRKASDVRSGSANLNWYHASAFEITVKQTLKDVEPGNYSFTSYIYGATDSMKATLIEIYYVLDGERVSYDATNDVVPWTSDILLCYSEVLFDDIEVTTKQDIEIGIHVTGPNGCWGHSDDWSFRENI